jgi:hypothetical protein
MLGRENALGPMFVCVWLSKQDVHTHLRSK